MIFTHWFVMHTCMHLYTHTHTHTHTHTVVKNLADILYLCVQLMAYGSVLMRATIHGIIINTFQSLASLPPILADGESLVTSFCLQLFIRHCLPDYRTNNLSL